jgi:hypothetical protein
MRALALLPLATFVAVTGGCMEKGLEDPKPLVTLDEAYFRCHVQPVIAKSCAAFACHGDGRRFFRVFARNRMRASGTEATRRAPMTQDELAANFDAARAFVDPSAPDQSFLLNKPLDIRAGGWFHRGADIFGDGNVFLSVDEPDYVTLRAWVSGATEDPSCIEPGNTQ